MSVRASALRCLGAACLFATLGCAPDQPEATSGCQSISDCNLGDVCDRPNNRCIPEPQNRALGAFACTVTDTPEAPGLELSEVIATKEDDARDPRWDDRWALPSVGCMLRPQSNALLLTMQSLTSGGALIMRIDVADLASGRVTVVPHMDVGTNAATLQDRETYDLFGSSKSGFVTFSGRAVVGAVLEGYLDVDFYPVVDLPPNMEAKDDVIFGVPCSRGLADCGEKTGDVGGAEACLNAESGPVCTRFCDNNSDCALGDGVCTGGLCTRPCQTHADCTPLQCFEGSPGQSPGCL